MPYVTRDMGVIVAKFNKEQYPGQEYLSPVDPELLFDDKKDELLFLLPQKYSNVITSITLSGDTFSLLPASLSLINSAITSANYYVAANVDLVLSDGSIQTYTIADANQVLADIVTYLNSAASNYNLINSAILSAPDLAALNAININSGWPS